MSRFESLSKKSKKSSSVVVCQSVPKESTFKYDASERQLIRTLRLNRRKDLADVSADHGLDIKIPSEWIKCYKREHSWEWNPTNIVCLIWARRYLKTLEESFGNKEEWARDKVLEEEQLEFRKLCHQYQIFQLGHQTVHNGRLLLSELISKTIPLPKDVMLSFPEKYVKRYTLQHKMYLSSVQRRYKEVTKKSSNLKLELKDILDSLEDLDVSLSETEKLLEKCSNIQRALNDEYIYHYYKTSEERLHKRVYDAFVERETTKRKGISELYENFCDAMLFCSNLEQRDFMDDVEHRVVPEEHQKKYQEHFDRLKKSSSELEALRVFLPQLLERWSEDLDRFPSSTISSEDFMIKKAEYERSYLSHQETVKHFKARIIDIPYILEGATSCDICVHDEESPVSPVSFWRCPCGLSICGEAVYNTFLASSGQSVPLYSKSEALYMRCPSPDCQLRWYLPPLLPESTTLFLRVVEAASSKRFFEKIAESQEKEKLNKLKQEMKRLAEVACPQCHTLFSYVGGCMHFTCESQKCSYEFCGKCFGRYNHCRTGCARLTFTNWHDFTVDRRLVEIAALTPPEAESAQLTQYTKYLSRYITIENRFIDLDAAFNRLKQDTIYSRALLELAGTNRYTLVRFQSLLELK